MAVKRRDKLLKLVSKRMALLMDKNDSDLELGMLKGFRLILQGDKYLQSESLVLGVIDKALREIAADEHHDIIEINDAMESV